MSAKIRKTDKPLPDNSLPRAETDVGGASADVLTAGEAAAYLRVAEEEVLRLAVRHELPGRQIGGTWRFLKAALQDWLRTPARPSGKDAMLALAGVWKDDPDIDEIVREAHQRRGRPMMEKGL